MSSPIQTLDTVSNNRQRQPSLPKPTIVVRQQRAVKLLCANLDPRIDHSQGFIDPEFPHTFSSINDNTSQADVEWMPAEKVTANTSYSSTMLSIQSGMFAKKSIAQALTLINWFANASFSEVFLRDLSGSKMYEFDVMVEGVFTRVAVDSFIPVDRNTKKQLFTKNYRGSIFPCIYEKLLAKIYGDYYSITSQFIDIVELQTFFCRQTLSLTRPIGLPELAQLITRKLEQQSMVCFRTRNSIRLESFGLESNHVYVVVRLLDRDGEALVEFLELEGESWIGKMSKVRSDWVLEPAGFIARNNIVLDNEEVKQNYMRLSDLKGMGRELIILNNTFQYHKNYETCEHNPNYVTMYRFRLQQSNKVMVRVDYKHKKCYNSLILIKTGSEREATNTIVQSSFHESKDSNYIEAVLEPGQYSLIVYNTHPQQPNLSYNITIFSSESFVELTPLHCFADIIPILESAFKHHFKSLPAYEKDSVILKQLYNWTGMAFAYFRPTTDNLTLTLKLRTLQECRILPLNIREVRGQQTYVREVEEGNDVLVIFRCLWSRKQNLVFDYDSKNQIQKMVFPPVGSLMVVRSKSK